MRTFHVPVKSRLGDVIRMEAERELRWASGDKGVAAGHLGVHVTTLRRWLRLWAQQDARRG